MLVKWRKPQSEKTAMNQHARVDTVPFIDVNAQRARLGRPLDEAIGRVLAHCQFIMGPEVGELERQLAAFCGARHVISCANGTDALLLVLKAWNIGPGDAVFCPAFTFCATAEVVALAGATPVLIDVDEKTFNIDPESLTRGIATARSLNLNPCAIIPVDLFGLPVDFSAIGAIAMKEGLRVLDDAAQGFGASYGNRKVGTLADATATSFYPSKPLSCFGDGGAIFTDDDALAATLKSLHVHGEGSNRYDNVRIGTNSRLDTLQAAILLEKLKIFPEEIAARNKVAKRYSDALRASVAVPELPANRTSVWAQYTIRIAGGRRDKAAADLKARGIPTAIHYARPLHRQPAYKDYPVAAGGLPVSEKLAGEVLSLPMHPYISDAVQDRIVSGVRQVLGG